MSGTNSPMFTNPSSIEAWVFDLDNTVYPPSADLFGQINLRMTAFIADNLGVSAQEADQLRTGYWAEFGTTLAGLVEKHDISSEAFLHETHQLDLSVLVPDHGLRAAIDALSGRRLIHTNGPRAHARRVLTARGLEDLFEAVVAIEDTNLVPKPQAAAYGAFLEQTGIRPARAAMIEDHVENLAEPKRLGMKTVWLSHDTAQATPAYVDHRIDDLEGFLVKINQA